MTHPSLAIIQGEHQALAAMLRSMSMLVEQAARDDELPPFDVLRAMLFYIDEFPEKLHHTKETQLLFPVLRSRCPELSDVLDRLDADHGQGEAAVRELGHLLLAFDVMGPSRRGDFESRLKNYVDGYLRHMNIEENLVLPAALKHLTRTEWLELNAAFEANADPLTGHRPAEQYEGLFRKILMSTPAPIGLGQNPSRLHLAATATKSKKRP